MFIVSLSLRRREELTDATFGLIPFHIQWANYIDAFSLMARYVVPIPILMMNSALATASAVFGALAISVLAAYAFAVIEFRGKRILFYIILLGLIVPIPMMLIPEFITVKAYGLIGSRLSLILPYTAFGLPLPILILTTYFKAIPKELFEAAQIDGASHLRVLGSVVLPMSRPALATCAIFLGLTFWNEFPLSLVIIHDPDLEDLVTTIHTVASELTAKGFGPQLLAAVFRFSGGEHPVYWVYGFKRGAFWPFVPAGDQTRDNATELELKAKLENELPIEPDLTRWLALFDAPL